MKTKLAWSFMVFPNLVGILSFSGAANANDSRLYSNESPFTSKYANCAALNKVFPGGVAKNSTIRNSGGKTKYAPTVNSRIYKENASKDRDKDGIACER